MVKIKKFICAVMFSAAASAIFCSPNNFTIPSGENRLEEVTRSEDVKEIKVCEEETEIQDLEQETDSKIYLGEFSLTAYCPCEKCCGQYGVNRPTDENGDLIVYGAYGQMLEAGVSIATDPNVIGFNQEVYINGSVYKAHDTGGNIKGNQIDIYMTEHDEAIEFGVKYADVYLILKKR